MTKCQMTVAKFAFWNVLALCLSTSLAWAVEPWADPQLPVRDGLLGWYDASRLEAYSKAANRPVPQANSPVDAWPDASGNKRDLLQSTNEAKPNYLVEGALRALRFDGRKKYFKRVEKGLGVKSLTGFVVIVPHANRRAFSGFLATSEQGVNDYSSGINIDFGPVRTMAVEAINFEGAGMPGVSNLLQGDSEFGKLLRMEFTSDAVSGKTSLWLNGKQQRSRDRNGNYQVRIDELVIGARNYNNGGPPEICGFFEGDIAEVLLYDRVLSEEERTRVEKYLESKYQGTEKIPLPPSAEDADGLIRVKSPPLVQMFVPGFDVRQLPIELPNINNVLYRADGKLVALGYNGSVYLLSDTNGDGLEDQIDTFYENTGEIRAPIGMDIMPPQPRQGMGLVVASKGKCSILQDTDNDGKADKELVVATGWKETPHGVDALGVAVDHRDQSIYFGLGCQNHTDAYGTANDGVPYSLNSERGTIMRIAPDLQSRSVVSTGIRFPVALRFNQLHDLFCTDQEGATWLPNGNPFDELLQIELGRHYGFPPRHPQRLPDVIDEPSVYDYGPQHQSTCGLNFNDPVNGGPGFGPEWWKSDALVTGYSRGKLYRTKLVKTEAGYIAQNQLIASLPLLPADACVSPAGSLVIAAHGGGPDWGSGPAGQGKLFKVLTHAETARPVFAWPQSPREIRVAFDAPLSPDQLKGLQAGANIDFGAAVAAGDRFEYLWPGYKVVQDQKAASRAKLAVQSVQVSADRKTLILATAPHPETATYALTLTGLGRPALDSFKAPDLSQYPDTDLSYNLDGVQAEWHGADGSSQSIWLPHLDPQVAAELTRPSQQHADFWSKSTESGLLTLRTRLDLQRMLRPEIQPGTRIDYELPQEQVAVTFSSPTLFEVTADGQKQSVVKNEQSTRYEAVVMAAKTQLAMVVSLPTGGNPADLKVTWSTQEDARPRAFPLRRMLLPWAPQENSKVPQILATDRPELRGGNWSRGKAVFFGEAAGCFKCHRVHGEGGQIGPDLSNLPHRDYESVLRDITAPSFAINPDYLTHVIALEDGRVLTGSIKTAGDQLLVNDTQGKTTTIQKDQIEEIKASSLSIMPDGLPLKIGPEQMRDLLTFLLTVPPQMSQYGPLPLPAPRSWEDVTKVLAGSQTPAQLKQKRIVLVAGAKDHGAGEHDYPAWKESWSQLLRMAENLTVKTADEWPSAEDLKSADVLVFYQHGQWTPQRARDIDEFLLRGGGLVYLHYAVDGGKAAPEFAQRIGLAFAGEASRFRHGPMVVDFEQTDADIIGRNFHKVEFHDESYWQLAGDPRRIRLLASSSIDGAMQPLFWTMEPSHGRVFVSIPGHYSWTFDDPLFRILVLRGIAWAAWEPVDRFNALALPGARVQ